MTFEKPKLFTTPREFFWVMAALLLVIVFRLGWDYRAYRTFVRLPFYYAHATVVHAYPKIRNGRQYTVLKMRSDAGKTLYTTTTRKTDLQDAYLYLQLFPSARITFGDYLGGMYCKSRIKRIAPPQPTLRMRLGAWIAQQHHDPAMQALYRAIFLASPIPKTLRTRIASLGVSHLVALSGFHLGILWAVLYGALVLGYRPIQQRYFPYRYALRDVGGVVMLLLGYYLWLTGSPPSLLRSYTMVLLGWGVVLMGIELVSFAMLVTIALLLIALFPPLVVSLGFWLSIAGVFYIFLTTSYCQDADTYLVSLVCIPWGIFLLMQPLVHGVFGLTTPWQLLSPLLSVAFILFYPLSFVLHLIGQGHVLDGSLMYLFDLPKTHTEHLLPLWSIFLYIILSLAATRKRWIFYLLLAAAGGYMVYLFVPYMSVLAPR